MASPRAAPAMGVESEPPRKRQKLSSTQSQPLNTTPSQLTAPLDLDLLAKMEAAATQPAQASQASQAKLPVPSDGTFQPEKEAQVGILHFVSVSTKNPGFSGVLKQRYTDFLVNEIEVGGNVVHLTNDRAPKFPRVAAAEPASTINNDAAKRIPTPPLIASKGPNTEEPSAATEAAHVDISLDGNSIPAPAESSNAAAISVSTISSEDRDLLVKYLDTSFVDQIIELDAKVQSKPDAKHTTFGSIESATITDRALRGKIHGAIRRIFESRLETESINDGIIKFTAAPKAARQNARQGGNTNGNGGAKTQNPRSQYQQQRGQVKGKVGWQELGGEHLHFSLYKENKDTMEVIMFLCKLLKVKAREFSFAGTKDRRAVTVQRVSVFRQHADRLAHLNSQLIAARIGDFKYEKHALELGELSGNQFTITLRDAHFGNDADLDEKSRVKLAHNIVGQAVRDLQSNGFLNYFGLQRFGTFGIGTDEVGVKLLKGDFKGAVEAILTYNEESLGAANDPDQYTSSMSRVGRDDIARAAAIHEFKTTGRSGEKVQLLPRKFTAETFIIRHLSTKNGKDDYLGAIVSINRNLRTMYVHAYQSLVWNFAASERWKRYGSKVIKGDLVIVDTQAGKDAVKKDEVDENGEIIVHPAADDVAVNHDDIYERARPLSTEEAESGQYTIFDIVLPTPGYDIEYPDNDIGDFYKEFMMSERGGGLDPADMRRKQKDFSLSGSYRKLLAQVGKDLNFEIKKYYDENEQLVETDYEKIKKVRGEHGNHQDRSGHQRGEQRERGGFQNNRGRGGRNGRGGGGGRYNDFFTRRPGHENGNSPSPPPPNHGAGQAPQKASPPNKNQAATNAWKALPEKLAADDKAAAIAWEQKRLNSPPVDPSTIKQPVYKETFIKTSADNEGRRTGFRSTTIVRDTAEDVKEAVEGAVKCEPRAPISETPATEVLKKGNQDPAVTEDVTMRGGGSESDDDEEDKTLHVKKSFESAISEDDSAGGVKLDTSASASPSKKRTVDEIYTSPTTEQPDQMNLKTIQESSTIASTTQPAAAAAEESSSTNLIAQIRAEPEHEHVDELLAQTPVEELERRAKIAVIVKFALGSSQYATMALRELMKAGGVKTYKPDFSGGR